MFFSKRAFFLLTGVISANFIFWGKSLCSICKTLAKTLDDVFKNLGMLLLVAAVLGLILWIPFSISSIWTVLNKKILWFLRCFCTNRLAGRKLYLSIAWSIGWVILSDDLLLMNLLSLIFNVDRAFLKNLFSFSKSDHRLAIPHISPRVWFLIRIFPCLKRMFE